MSKGGDNEEDEEQDRKTPPIADAEGEEQNRNTNESGNTNRRRSSVIRQISSRRQFDTILTTKVNSANAKFDTDWETCASPLVLKLSLSGII